SSQHHADDVGGQDCLAAGPHSQSPHCEQKEEYVLGFQFGNSAPILLEESGCKEGENSEDHNTDAYKDQSFQSKWREDQPQSNHCSQIVNEAGGQHSLPKICNVEPQFQHHRVDDRHGSGGKGDARQPTGPPSPMQNIVGNCRASKKRSEETHQSNDCRLFPFRPEDLRIELSPGQECKNDGTGSGEKADPACLPTKFSVHEKRTNHQLGDSADNNFTQGSGYPEPDGKQRRDQGEADPNRGHYPHVLHGALPRLVSADRCRYYDSVTRQSACQESSAVPAQELGQRLAVNSFTVVNSTSTA